MPSVLDQKFKVTFVIPVSCRNEVERYLEKNVGGRTYYLHTKTGGKHWAIERNQYGNTVKVSLDDESLASFIMLKFV